MSKITLEKEKNSPLGCFENEWLCFWVAVI